MLWLPRPEDESWKEPLRLSIATEAMVHLDDLLMRRSCLGDNPERALRLAPEVCTLFGWDDAHTESELAALRRALYAAGARVSPDAPGLANTGVRATSK